MGVISTKAGCTAVGGVHGEREEIWFAASRKNSHRQTPEQEVARVFRCYYFLGGAGEAFFSRFIVCGPSWGDAGWGCRQNLVSQVWDKGATTHHHTLDHASLYIAV